jgi:hypothetical protein
MDKKLNPITWYSNRELQFTPAHFIISKTSLTNESILWIINNLKGRYSIVSVHQELDIISNPWLYVSDLMGSPAFEDPKEAILYELTWS